MNDKILATTAAGSAGVAVTGASITIATVPLAVTTTSAASGIAGLLGFTTTTTTIVAAPVVVPAAAIVAIGGLLTLGGIKAVEAYTRYSKSKKTT